MLSVAGSRELDGSSCGGGGAVLELAMGCGADCEGPGGSDGATRRLLLRGRKHDMAEWLHGAH